jgi:hypothetical protein
MAGLDFAVLKGVFQELIATGVISVIKNGTIEELDLLKTFFSQPKVILRVTSAFALNIGAQFLGNCCIDGSFSTKAFLKVDYWDAMADGAITTITMNGSLLYQLFTKSEKVYLYNNLGKAFKLEFLIADIDVSPQESIVIRDFFNSDLDAWNTFCLFTIAKVSSQMPVNEISESLVIWNKTYVNTFANGLSATSRPVFDQMDNIIKTQGFKLFCDQSTEVIETIISEVINNHYNYLREEGLKIQTKKESTNSTDKDFHSFIIESEFLPLGSTIPDGLVINLE